MINKDDLIYLSKLAKIPINKNVIDEFKEQISEIISFISILSEVDTAGIDPFFEVNGLENVLREDIVQKIDFDKSLFGYNAISFDHSYFKINKIL